MFAMIFQPFLIFFSVATLLLVSCTDSNAAENSLRAAYERADILQNNFGGKYYRNNIIVPNWLGRSEMFWYRRETGDGYRFILVDARSGEKTDLFDHGRLVSALSKIAGERVSADKLPLRHLRQESADTFSFVAFDKAWLWDGRRLKETGDGAEVLNAVISPDGRYAAFVRDHNVWVRDSATGKARALTEDGREHYSFATGLERSVVGPAELLWSPDSSKIFTIQTDERTVRTLPIIDFAPAKTLRPSVTAHKRAWPGDEQIPAFRPVVIEVKTGQQTKILYDNLPAVRMGDAPIGGNRAWWSADSGHVYFVDIERGEKTIRLMAADAKTGETRELFSESNPNGYVELAQNVYSPATLYPLPQRNQLIWYSERAGWAHLYLYDLKAGALIRPLTSGKWAVRDILHLDEEEGALFVSLSGRMPGKNPYYKEIARIDLDRAEMEIISSGDNDRQVIGPGMNSAIYEQSGFMDDPRYRTGFSPSGAYWVETRARVDGPSQTVLRRTVDESVVAVIENAEMDGLPAGFSWPEPIVLKGADDKTDIHAIICRPSDFDPKKRYPIIDYIYGGPQTEHVTTSFTRSAEQAQAFAELGFIAVVIDGRGTTGRSRAFHEASYGAVETASNLDDHIAVIRALARRHPYIDDSRVGIFGISGGGYMATSAMLRYPEFFDVGVAAAGNHDQRLFRYSWGERYQGFLKGDNYLLQANETYAGNLKGDLLLIHGMLDSGVHPAGFFRLVQVLIDENKDFDMLALPRGGHEMPAYALRRTWNYFVEHLLDEMPPEGFEIKESWFDAMRKRNEFLVGSGQSAVN